VRKYRKDLVVLTLHPLRFSITYILYSNRHGDTSPTNNQQNMNLHRSTVENEVLALTPMHLRGTTKAPASSQTTRPGGVRSGRAPWQSEGEGAAGELNK
jgi:hypothetical protein